MLLMAAQALLQNALHVSMPSFLQTGCTGVRNVPLSRCDRRWVKTMGWIHMRLSHPNLSAPRAARLARLVHVVG